MKNNSTNVEQQRSIQFITVGATKRSNEFETIFALYLPEKNVIKSTENTKINTRISINILNNLYATITLMPASHGLGLNILNDDLIQNKETLFFHLQDHNFTRTFTFKITTKNNNKLIHWFVEFYTL